MNYIHGFTTRSVVPSRRGEERMRTIVVIAPAGTIPLAFKQAAEHAFPWAMIEEVGHVDQAVRIFPNTVSLLLVHPDFVKDAERSASDLFRYHPMALTAAIDDGKGTQRDAAIRLFSSPLVRSVLPIHVRSEIALSIMALLLQGIEYFPRALLGTALGPVEEPEPEALPPTENAIPAHLRVLTKRELQVLELVQRGLQNKSIACDLNLSGHTVKIHLHNIISKLGARNRTEAAAIYRRTGTEVALN